MGASDMVERVAKCLHEKLSEQDINGYLGANFDLHAAARAAIAEMREPTEGMVEEGADVAIGTHYCGSYGAKEVYSAMIDAALTEQDTP